MHHLQKKKIENFLSSYGLSENAIETYISLIENKKVTILELSRKTGIGRVTTHYILQKLLDQGLVVCSFLKGKKLFEPISFPLRKERIDQKKQLRASVEQNFSDVAPILKSYMDTSPETPQIQMFGGTKGLEYMFENVLLEKETMYVLSDNKRFSSLMPPYRILDSYRKRVKLGIKTFMIFSEDFLDIYADNPSLYDIEIRTVPPGKISHGSINLRGDKIAFHFFQKERSLSIIITSSLLKDTLLFMWKIIWENAKKYDLCK